MINTYLEPSIGIIGLGKLGLPMLCAFISRGFDVYGYDTNTEYINYLLSKPDIKEPGLNPIITNDKHWKNRFFTNIHDLQDKTDIIFIIVPTNSLTNHNFDTSILYQVIENVNQIAVKQNRLITCVITSTVNPGDCKKISLQLQNMTKSCVKLVYSPEFIALGSVLEDMLNPDFVLLGGEDNNSIESVFNIYRRLYKSKPSYHKLGFFEAETAKIAVNSYITQKISFANMIGQFLENNNCSKVSITDTLKAIGSDSRIGNKYFKYGGCYGGPCFPRDNLCLISHLNESNTSSHLPSATDRTNHDFLEFWLKKLEKYDAIIMVGIAYKKGTDYTGQSFMLKLAEKLFPRKVYFHDDNIYKFSDLEYVTPKNIKKISEIFKRVLILINYGNFDINPDVFRNVDVINIW